MVCFWQNHLGQYEDGCGVISGACEDVCNEEYLAGDYCSGLWHEGHFYDSGYTLQLPIVSPLPTGYTMVEIVLVFDGAHSTLALDVFAGGDTYSDTVPVDAVTHTMSITLLAAPETWSGSVKFVIDKYLVNWGVEQIILHTGDASACLRPPHVPVFCYH